MAFWPMQAIVYRPAHVHANLLGFVSMMIFGVAYHVIPRFAGRPLHSRRLPAVHLWVSNLGLAGMVLGFLARPWFAGPGTVVLGAGALLSAAGAVLFIHNLWHTLGESPRVRPLPAAEAEPPRRHTLHARGGA